MKNLEFEPKLITRYVDYGALYECPICQYKIDTTHTDANFCPQCGIKFAWDTEQSKRRDFAKHILEYWMKTSTDKTILYLQEIAEIDSLDDLHCEKNKIKEV